MIGTASPSGPTRRSPARPQPSSHPTERTSWPLPLNRPPNSSTPTGALDRVGQPMTTRLRGRRGYGFSRTTRRKKPSAAGPATSLTSRRRSTSAPGSPAPNDEVLGEGELLGRRGVAVVLAPD